MQRQKGGMAIQTNRVDTLLAIALLPYLTYLARHGPTIGDAIEVGLVVLVQARLLLSITGNLPMTPFENSFGGAMTAVTVLVLLNLLVAYVPALRKRL